MKTNKHEHNDVIKQLSNGYSNFDLYKKLYTQNMDKKHKPVIKFNDIKHTLPYEYEKKSLNMGLHIGQRKLLLSEIQFLTKHDADYCIYVGAAPSNKTHFLSNLFPHIKFILVDPNKFEIHLTDTYKSHRCAPNSDVIHMYHEYPTKSFTYKSNKKLSQMTSDYENDALNYMKNSSHRIFIWEDYMTMKMADFLKKLGKTVFISDIRTKLNRKRVDDLDIIWNRSMVHNWISTIQPEMSMVKFRIPYYDNIIDFDKHTKKIKDIYTDDFNISKKFGIDFRESYDNGEFKMSKAALFIQPWKGETSGEMRGHIEKKDIFNIVSYDRKQIEDKLHYYNRIERVMFHINKNTNKKMHFCNCNDCAIENIIWVNYIKKTKSGQTVYDYINIANIITKRKLTHVHDINIYTPLTYKLLKKMMNITNKSTKYNHLIVQKGNFAPS
jgi:hypothetical protein